MIEEVVGPWRVHFHPASKLASQPTSVLAEESRVSGQIAGHYLPLCQRAEYQPCHAPVPQAPGEPAHTLGCITEEKSRV